MTVQSSISATEGPIPTGDIEQGKRNLDAYGFTVHEELLTPDEVSKLRDRLCEQAELECEEGVATYRLAERVDTRSPIANSENRPLAPRSHGRASWRS